jgi:hypothetical protein
LDSSKIHQSAQCVPENAVDLVEFCQDKLHAAAVANRQDELKDELKRTYQESMAGKEDQINQVVRQCNPFNIKRKQILDCLLIQRPCGDRYASNDDFSLVPRNDTSSKGIFMFNSINGAIGVCVPTMEIETITHDCTGFDVCRKYDQELDSDITVRIH